MQIRILKKIRNNGKEKEIRWIHFTKKKLNLKRKIIIVIATKKIKRWTRNEKGINVLRYLKKTLKNERNFLRRFSYLDK